MVSALMVTKKEILCAALPSCKKLEKLDALICNKTFKTHFGTFFAQIPQFKIFPQKTIGANLKPLCCCIFT